MIGSGLFTAISLVYMSISAATSRDAFSIEGTADETEDEAEAV